MNPELISYVEQCRMHGMNDEQIRSALVSAGWGQDLIDAAVPVQPVPVQPVPVQPVAPVTPPVEVPITPVTQAAAIPAATNTVDPAVELGSLKKPRRRWILLISLILGLVILLSGALIAFGEQGYLPAVSRVYRKTLLPLSWKGTTGNAGISLSQAIAATTGAHPITVTANFTLKGDAAAAAGLFASNTLPLPGAKINASEFADVATSKQGTYTFSVTTTVDASNQISADLSVDIPKDDPLRTTASGYINPDFTKLTMQSVVPSSGDAFYFKTNALPSAILADAEKWFKVPLGKATVQTKQTSIQSDLITDSSMRDELLSVINSVTQDNGIIRRNGVAEAWYTTTLTPAAVTQFSKDEKLPASVRNSFADLAKQWTTGTMVTDWYLTTRNPVLTEAIITFQITNTSGTYNGTTDLKFAYGVAAKTVDVPDSNLTWGGISDYVTSIQKAYPNLNSTGAVTSDVLGALLQQFGVDMTLSSGAAQIRNDDITRTQEVTRLAINLEQYKQDHANAVPTTNSQYVRLDSTTNPLCTSGIAPACPIIDPVPDKYWYSYWSDGTSYRLVTVSLADDGTRKGFYLVQDGVSQPLVTTLP